MSEQETDDLRLLYFDPQTTYLVPHVMRSYENSLQFQRRIFDWTPYEKTSIMLRDFSDYGNAATLSSPSNLMWVDVAPLNHTFETFPAVERIFMLMNHEMVHVATGDVSNEQDRKWRRFFGGKPYPLSKHPETLLYHYLTVPRMVAPRWYFEGIAVFMETWMAGGVGRAQGAYDEMKFRSLVRDNAPFYSNLGLVAEGTATDFQTETNAYFYGTRFMSYLAYTYSPQSVIEWIKRGEGSERYYAKQFAKVFGKPLEAAWDDWIAFEKQFQQKNLAAIRQVPPTAKQPLTKSALGSVSRAFVDDKTQSLIAGFYYPGVVAYLGAISLADGSPRRLADIKAPMKYKVTSLAFDPEQRVLFYTSDNLKWRDLVTIGADGGKSQVLIKDARIGDLVFNRADSTLWGIRNQNGWVMLVRLKPPYQQWETLLTLPYGQVLSDLDISPDGLLLSATMEEVDGTQYLRIFRTEDLLKGQYDVVSQFDFGRAVPENFVFSPDGRYLFGSSYYTGVSNIFRYEVANGDIQAVTNAETGFFLPVPMKDGSLIAFEYTGQGFVPDRIDPVPQEDLMAITFLGNEIVKKYPIVTQWAVGSPAKVDLESLHPRKGEYHPDRELGYSSGYPIIEGYRNTYALGWSVLLQDPMTFKTLSADVSYSLNTDNDSVRGGERLHADVEYRALFWRFRYWHNDADFYDLFGPTERARKGDAYIAGYKYPVILDGPRQMDVDFDVSYYTGLDTLPGNQNVSAVFSRLLSARAGLLYKYTKNSLGAVDHEKGVIWNLTGYADHAAGEVVPKLQAGFDFGFALPIKHSSLWFYNAAGISGGARDNPLGNWYFGAFGNNYVDDKEVKRYREYFSFPGFDIDELNAQDFFKTVAEWNLPPIRFDNIGLPSVFLSAARPALFAGALLTDFGDRKYRENYFNLGFQVDFRFTIAHRHPMSLSVGYAKGFVGSESASDEFMISLKVL
ncbi:MAG: hypothetical protein PVJ33_14625 [Lysobacterales bacterium]